MNIKERLKIFIKHSNLSISAFEKSISVSTGYVNNLNKSIGADKLDFIAVKYPQLNLGWLRFGEGEMLKSNFNEDIKDEYQETEPVAKRLTEFTEKQKISIKDFALKCDINYNNTASLLKGSLPLGMGVLQKIKKAFPELNTEWVLFGNGAMDLNTQLVSSQNPKEVEQLEQVNYLLNSALRDKDKTISSLENQIALLQELKDIKTQDVSPVKSNMDR